MSFLDCLHPCTFTCSEASYSLLKILSCSAMGCAFLLRSQRCVRRENFKSLFHKCETQREGFFWLPTLVLTSNNKARIYLWFSSWNVTDFCGLASLKSMYTVWGSGRQGNLIVSILGELGKDDMKATSLSTESIYIFLTHPLPYPEEKSFRAQITIETGLWKKLCAWLPHQFKLFCLLSTTFWSSTQRFSCPPGIQVTGSIMRDIKSLKTDVVKLFCRTKRGSYCTQ